MGKQFFSIGSYNNNTIYYEGYFTIASVDVILLHTDEKKKTVLMLRVLAAAPASLCHSNDADSAAVMTFPHCHANIPRSLWPAVSLSPTISPGLANKLPGPSLDTEWRPQSSWLMGINVYRY